MISAADIAREQDAGLQLLFQRGLELALKLQDDAMAAESADERARLGAAFHRISRSLRQTLALEARLDRDATAEGVHLETARLARRKAQVKATVERLIWTETETQEREDHLCDLLETFLDEDHLHGRLADGDIDPHITRLCGEIGLKDPPLRGRWPEGPEGVAAHEPATPRLSTPSPPPAELPLAALRAGGASDDADDYWRSSA